VVCVRACTSGAVRCVRGARVWSPQTDSSAIILDLLEKAAAYDKYLPLMTRRRKAVRDVAVARELVNQGRLDAASALLQPLAVRCRPWCAHSVCLMRSSRLDVLCLCVCVLCVCGRAGCVCVRLFPWCLCARCERLCVFASGVQVCCALCVCRLLVFTWVMCSGCGGGVCTRLLVPLTSSPFPACCPVCCPALPCQDAFAADQWWSLFVSVAPMLIHCLEAVRDVRGLARFNLLVRGG
jgi:hypothetical protein